MGTAPPLPPAPEPLAWRAAARSFAGSVAAIATISGLSRTTLQLDTPISRPHGWPPAPSSALGRARRGRWWVQRERCRQGAGRGSSTSSPAGGAGTRQLAPKDGGEVEADQIVQRAPGHVGVDQILIDHAGVLEGVFDGRLGDLVEDIDGLVDVLDYFAL